MNKKSVSFINKYLNMWNSMAIQVKAATAFMLCSIFSQIVSVCMTAVLTRLLSTDDFGISSNYAAWYNIVNNFFTLSLNAGVYNNAMLKYEKNRDDYTASMMGLSMLLGGIGVLIALIAGRQLSGIMSLPPVLILFMAIQCLFYNPYGCWISRTKYEYNYKQLIAMTLFTSVGSSVLSVLCVLEFRDGAIGKVVGSNLLTILVGVVLLCTTLKKSHQIFNWEYWKYALNFNVPLIPHYLSQVILNQSDRVMITKMCSSAENGLYSLAYTASTMISVANNAITQALTPWAYSHLKERSLSQIQKHVKQLLYLYVLVVFIFIMIAPELIIVLAGERYRASIYVVPPVTVSMYFVLLYNFFSILEFYHEKTKAVMICSVSSAILNVILNYVFISKFGYLAAAYTTLVCYVINSLIHAGVVKRICKKEYAKEDVFAVRTSLIIGLLMIVLVFVSVQLYRWSVARYILTSILALLCIVERKKILRVLKRVLGRTKTENQ